MNLDQLKSNPAVLRLYSQRIQLKRDGKEYVSRCPFHQEKTPSFKIYEHEGVFLWKCFGCNRSGNIFQFIEKFDKITIKAAIQLVDEQLNNNWDSQKEEVEHTFKPIEESKEKEKLTFNKWLPFEKALSENKEAINWLEKERGINYDTAKRLHLGYRQDVGKMAGQENQNIADKGWIAFPCIRDGMVESIKYRSISRKSFCKQPRMSTVLFNTNTIDPFNTEPLYVVEGEFDAIVLEQAGFHSVAVPNASTKITPEMKDQLLSADTVILAGDNDTVGNESMDRLWTDLQERTHKLIWPDGLKDANEVFLKKCKRNIEEFKNLVQELTINAKAIPMPNVHSLAETMLAANRTNLSDNPNRLRFPWSTVDNMVILLPGSVLSVFATNTKMGKTALEMNITVHNAKKYEQCVLNYQCELSEDEFANIVAAHLLRKNRNTLSKDDYKSAAKLLKDTKYYIGRNPTLTTVTPVLDLIEAAIRRLGATIVVLDHIHFICRNEENEVQAQANAMQRIKNMAVKYGVKFIVIGQPRKANQQSKGKVVHITDAKGSESFTSDADAVIAIHRNYISVKDPNNPPKDDYDPKTEVHLLGARSKGEGNTFTTLNFVGTLATFVEPASEQLAAQEPTKPVQDVVV